MRSENNWIRTFSGKRFWPLDPSPDEVCIEDIAHALANQCRWTGHTRVHFSVAQHSLLVSENCKKFPLEGLLHDASEAYLSDIARPVKKDARLWPVYREFEEKLEQAIAQKFNLTYPWPEEVKAADDVLLRTEWRDLMPGQEISLPPLQGCLVKKISPLSPRQAELRFLARFAELTRDR